MSNPNDPAYPIPVTEEAHAHPASRPRGGGRVTRCINNPCQLPPDHEGPCSSADPDDDERDDNPYCDCGNIPSEEEDASNRCSACGKRLDP